MNNIENIGMPYREREGYVEALVSRAVEQAVGRSHQTRKQLLYRWVAAAAVAGVLLTGAFLTYYNITNNSKTSIVAQTQSPVDEFLGSLTDEEVLQLNDYELEEIEY